MRGPARRGDDEVDLVGRHRQRALGAVTEVQLRVEHLEDLGPLGHLGVGLGRLGVDDVHPGAVLEERVGGREAGDAQPGDDDPQAGPVGLAAGQTGQTLLAGGGVGHGAPTTHSA